MTANNTNFQYLFLCIVGGLIECFCHAEQSEASVGKQNREEILRFAQNDKCDIDCKIVMEIIK